MCSLGSYNSFGCKIMKNLSHYYATNDLILKSKRFELKLTSCNGSFSKCFSSHKGDDENFTIVKRSSVSDEFRMGSNIKDGNKNRFSITSNKNVAESLITQEFAVKTLVPKVITDIADNSKENSGEDSNSDRSSIDSKSVKLSHSKNISDTAISVLVETETVESFVASRSPPSNSSQEKAIQSGVPEVPTTCCQSGCPNCVWLDYADHLTQHYKDGGKEALAAIHRDIEDPNLREYLLFELRMKK